jgi:hypothetical protein
MLFSMTGRAAAFCCTAAASTCHCEESQPPASGHFWLKLKEMDKLKIAKCFESRHVRQLEASLAGCQHSSSLRLERAAKSALAHKCMK